MQNSKTRVMVISLCLLSPLLIVACSSIETPTVPEESATAAAPSDAALAILVKADAADGTVDKVVAQCATCMLAMTGRPETAASYGDYTLHFCSEQCKDHFVAQPEEVLLALEFPEE